MPDLARRSLAGRPRRWAGVAFALLSWASLGLAPAVSAQGLPGHPAPYLVDDLAPGLDGLGPNHGGGIAPLGDDLVILVSTEFLSDASDPIQDWIYTFRIFRSDGTADGTYELLPEDRALAAWFATDGPVHFLFVCENATFTSEGLCGTAGLWRTDGTVEGTYELTAPGSVSYFWFAHQYGYWSKELRRFFFVGYDPDATESDGELWVSDGTKAGTRLLKDVNPDGNGIPRSFFDFEGAVWFLVNSQESVRWGRTDGTAEGTVIPPYPLVGEASAQALLPGDDELFAFLASHSSSSPDVTLWRVPVDAGPATLLAELGPIRFDGFETIPPDGGKLFFFVDSRPYPNGPVTAQLWVSDGTPAGTRIIPQPEGTPEWVSSRIFHNTRVIGDLLYLNLEHPEHGKRPWVTDGTAAGTRMIPLLCEDGDCPAIATGYFSLLGETLLVPRTEEANAEPHFYDPESGALRKLAELCPGECGTSSVGPRETVESVAYLFVNDDLHGEQFWVTDGTPAGTRRVTDFPIRAGWFVRQVFPTGFQAGTTTAVANGRLFFGANDRTHGWELWALPIPREGAEFPARPPTEPLSSDELPGYAVWVRISAAATSIVGRSEPDCIPETLCVSGAVPGRSEVFVRVVGPKPNGFLWPTLVKFTTSTVEVWIEQLATGTIRYYRLDGATPGSSVLPGLFDRGGFMPE